MSSEWIKRHLDRWSNLDERMPVDVLPASNGEFLPAAPNEKQLKVMALQDEAAEEARHKLGMSRRSFVRTSSAIGVGFWAINQVYRGEWGHYVSGADAGVIGDDACQLDFPDSFGPVTTVMPGARSSRSPWNGPKARATTCVMPPPTR